MLLSKFASNLLSRSQRLPILASNVIVKQPMRHGSKKVLYMFRTNRSVRSFRKWMVFYTLIGAVPAALIIFYANFFVGEAELYAYDPEQYEPEFHEFYAHPITRFLAKYCVEDPKIAYYKSIYALEFEAHQKRMTQLTRATREIEKFMGHNGWHVHEDTLRHQGEKESLEKYIEEHQLGVKVKR